MRYFIFLCLFLTLISCSKPEKSCNVKGLIKTANMYFNAEKSKNWDFTYELRYEEFKESVPVSVYVNQMNKDSKGWKMISYTLGKFKISTNQAEILVEVKEEVPIKLRVNEESSITFKGILKFVCKNNEWYILEAPSRNHFSLNTAIVPLN